MGRKCFADPQHLKLSSAQKHKQVFLFSIPFLIYFLVLGSLSINVYESAELVERAQKYWHR
jgi:hypothetical protein